MIRPLRVRTIRIHGPEVATVVEKALFPAGPPNNLKVADVINALGAHLDRQTTGLVNADRSHTSELADDEGVRQVRDERTVDLKDLLSTLRSNLIRNYGPIVAGAYGLGAALPDDAPGLLLLAGNVETLLRSRALVEPAKNQSLKIDPVLAANDVRDSAAAPDLAQRVRPTARRRAGLPDEETATPGAAPAVPAPPADNAAGGNT